MGWNKDNLSFFIGGIVWLVTLFAGCQVADSSTTLPAPTATAIPPTETIQILESPTAVPPAVTPEIDEMKDKANADVIDVKAVLATDNTWTFHVTVWHPDTGWEDYADGWDVVLPDGTVVKPDPDSSFTRLLLHPHENEQPFTRSQSQIEIPQSVTLVTVRAHDLVDGFGGKEILVDLSAESGPGYRVER